MPRNERKFWPPLIKHDHVLGEIRQVTRGVGVISALYLYEHSICRGDEPPTLPPARVESIIGASGGIRCTICGCTFDWDEPPSEAYARLTGHYPRKDV